MPSSPPTNNAPDSTTTPTGTSQGSSRTTGTSSMRPTASRKPSYSSATPCSAGTNAPECFAARSDCVGPSAQVGHAVLPPEMKYFAGGSGKLLAQEVGEEQHRAA